MMREPSEDAVALLSENSVTALRRSLLSMGGGPYPAFVDWVLKRPDLRSAWAQAMGLTATIKLVTKLLHGLLTPGQLREVSPQLAVVHCFWVYEQVSDNLAIGLTQRLGGAPPDVAERVALLHGFSQTMRAYLTTGDLGSARGSLLELSEQAERTSILSGTLGEGGLRSLLSLYARDTRVAVTREIEFSVVPNLLANLAMCDEQLRNVDGGLRFLLRSSLNARYAGVDRLISSPPSTPDELTSTGAATILVVPTLTYLTAVADRVLGSQAQEPSLLERCFSRAALLVRLTNDCGVDLLQDPHNSMRFFERLEHLGTAHPEHTLADLLLQNEFATQTRLTRLRKDLVLGEFNVALDGLAHDLEHAEAVQAFITRIDHYSRVYQKVKGELMDDLACLGDTPASRLALRFVTYHEQVYSRPFDSASGEYAIATD